MGREILIESHFIDNLDERNNFLKGRENKVSYLVMRAYAKSLTDSILYITCNQRQREAYTLHREGYKNKAIAEKLGLEGKNPASHARQLIYQARKKIINVGKKIPKQDLSFIERYDIEE
ncbi:MAG: hypothetical protein ACRC0G_15960 [Fusobacteriaceae bacterium]